MFFCFFFNFFPFWCEVDEALPPPPRSSEAGRFLAKAQLANALVVGLRLPAVWPLPVPLGSRPALLLRAAAALLGDADGLVAGVGALRGELVAPPTLVGLGVNVPHAGVEVAGGRRRHQALELGDAAVVVLAVVLVDGVVAVRPVDGGVDGSLRRSDRIRSSRFTCIFSVLLVQCVQFLTEVSYLESDWLL